MRDLRSISMSSRLLVAVVLASVLLPLGHLIPVALAADGAVPMSLARRVEQKGTGRVIVQMDVPAVPEASLGAKGAVDVQRRAIRSTQKGLMTDLGASQVEVKREFASIPYVALKVDADALAALEASPRVVRVVEDQLAAPTLIDSVPIIAADEAWSLGFDGGGRTIAVLDTGFDLSHPFLTGAAVDQACFSDGDCPNGESTQFGAGAAAPCDVPSQCDHGTHVAGIALGAASSVPIYGVSPASTLIAIQVFSILTGESCGGGADPCARTYTSDWVAGLERVYELRNTYDIAAANLSLGGGKFTSQATCDSEGAANGSLAIVAQLRGAGIATVVAAGNEGHVDALSSPGCLSNVVSVGATTKLDTVAVFSNSASFLSLLAPGDGYVDFQGIESSIPGGGYGFKAGTSMAAPHVAGAWGVLKEKSPSASVDEVLSAMQTTGVPVVDGGNGLTKPRLDVLAALNALPSAGVGGIVASLEAPTSIASGISNLQGWAFTSTPGASIDPLVSVFIDGVYMFSAPCCSDRGDVQAAFPGAPLLSGFSAVFNWQLLAPGNHDLAVQITSTAGESLTLVSAFESFRPGNFSFLTNFQWTDAGAQHCISYNQPAAPFYGSIGCTDFRITSGNQSLFCNDPSANYYVFDPGSQSFKLFADCE